MAQTNSKVGKQYTKSGGQLSLVISPQAPVLPKIDLDNLKYAYLSAKNPFFPNRWMLYEIYDNVQVDSTLTSLIQKRILKVQKAKFMLMGKDNKPNSDAAKFFETQWFLDFLKYSMESIFYGHSLIEIFNFKPDGQIDTINLVDRYYVKPEKGIVTKYPQEQDGADYLNPPISTFYIPVGNPKDIGILYKAAVHIIAKKYALGHWAAFNEKFGIPFRSVTSPGINAARQKQLGIIMEQMGSSGWAVLNENEKVELLDLSGTNPTQCFEALIGKLDAEVANLIIGQSTTSNSMNNKGTSGNMQIMADISNDIHDSDLVFIKFIVNALLIPRMIQYGYKLDGLSFEWDKSVDVALPEMIDYIVKLGALYDIPVAFIAEKTGIPITGKIAIPPPIDLKKKVQQPSISAFYKAGKCCTPEIVAEADVPDEFGPLMRKIAANMMLGKQDNVVNLDLIKATANHLLKGLTAGYTEPEGGFTERDNDIIAQMKQNIYVFSGFKTEKTLKAASALLLDDKGNIRSKSDFTKQVLGLNPTYNGAYLDAEYDNAFVSADSAAQWQTIQKTKDTLPFMRYDAVMDNRTTNLCAGINGLTVLADSPLLDTYMTPNHWKERGIWHQMSSGVVSDQSKFDFIEPVAMFKQNVGKTGIIFPDTHPYFEASQQTKNKVIKAVNKLLKDKGTDS